jgi:hypothetical protein
MTLPHIQIARAHWLLGALFLAIILEEYLPRADREGRPVRSRSLVVPWALMIGGVGVWATTVFADIVHDMFIHTLWADILFAAGALELARRKGVYERPWLDGVLPFTFASCGALFIVHERIDPSGAGASWHIVLGSTLIAAGLIEFGRFLRRRASPMPLALVPLSVFAILLVAIPVAAAS